MPTIVLSDPVADRIKSGGVAPDGLSSAGSTAAKIVAPQIKKAIELGGKARSIIERRLKALSANSPSTSSTAKTKDLNPPAGVCRRMDRVSARPENRRRPTLNRERRRERPRRANIRRRFRPGRVPTGLFANNNNGTVDVSTAPAKLVSRGDEIEFGIFGMRTVIGRSKEPSDKLDIDLKKLAHGGDRVSRRHAEIVLRGADYFIRDLGSLNGTYVAGRGKLGRDQLYKLKDRDQVVLGGAILQFRRG